MKVFVTGATGYIGGSVSERLVASGHQVVGLVRSKEKAPLLERRGIVPVLGTLDDLATRRGYRMLCSPWSAMAGRTQPHWERTSS